MPPPHRPPCNPPPRIYEPGSTVAGRTTAEWQQAWYQWAYSYPEDPATPGPESPFNDPDGRMGYLGDQGDVFFLIGANRLTTDPPPANQVVREREITVPSDVPLFFPVMSAFSSRARDNVVNEGDAIPDEIQLRDRSVANISDDGVGVAATDGHLIIDGKAVADVTEYREESGNYSITLPYQNTYIIPPNTPQIPPGGESITDIAYSDGYWVMLKPLSPGQHTVSFGGTFINEANGAVAFDLEIIYTLNVVSRKKYEADPMAPHSAPVDKAVYAPHSTIAGQTMNELADQWWQWALSHEADESPFYDTDGDAPDADFPEGDFRPHLGDQGDVFFLTGVFDVTGKADRRILAPAKTPFFFPIVNVEWSDFENFGDTYEELRYWADLHADRMFGMEVWIDGKEVVGVENYREGSKGLVEATLPANSVWGDIGAETTIKLVSDGYWMGVKPLSPGVHTIRFKGGNDFAAGEAMSPLLPDGPDDGTEPDQWFGREGPEFELDITYELVVLPERLYERLRPDLPGEAVPPKPGHGHGPCWAIRSIVSDWLKGDWDLFD